MCVFHPYHCCLFNTFTILDAFITYSRHSHISRAVKETEIITFHLHLFFLLFSLQVFFISLAIAHILSFMSCWNIEREKRIWQTIKQAVKERHKEVKIQKVNKEKIYKVKVLKSPSCLQWMKIYLWFQQQKRMLQWIMNWWVIICIFI